MNNMISTQLLESPPTMTLGIRIRENVLSVEALISRIQHVQLCEKAYFQYRVTVRKKFKIRFDGNDDWRTITLFYWNTHFLNLLLNLKSEVRIMKILDEYEKEITIPSIYRPTNVSYCMISREIERFVHEIHDHKENSGPVRNC